METERGKSLDISGMGSIPPLRVPCSPTRDGASLACQVDAVHERVGAGGVPSGGTEGSALGKHSIHTHAAAVAVLVSHSFLH